MPEIRTSPDGTPEPVRAPRSEKGWTLVSRTAFDGLTASQLVRQMNCADRGLGGADDFSDLPERIDSTADADDRTNTGNVTTDARRYVIDPKVEGHVYKGLFTGGPVVQFEDRGHKVLRQTLTLTFRAESDPAAALRAHRPVVRRVFQNRMAFDPAIPGSYRTEVSWRDFTHESFGPLEALTVEEVRGVIAAHAGLDRVASVIAETNCSIDPQTNTVVFTAAGLYKESAAPATVDALLKCPKVEAPCTRETLRAFGLNALADGEGYRYAHTFRFLDIADTPQVRRLLEFGLSDKALLPKLLPRDFAADSPALDNAAADGKGRFYVTRGGARQPWFRIVLMRVEKQEEDGLLSFTVVAHRPEWHGADARGARRTLATQNPRGPGMAKQTVIPSVPTEAAEQVAAAAQPDAGQAIVSAQVVDAGEGASDIRLGQAPEWRFDGTEGGDPPRVVSSLDGKDIPATSLRHTSTAMEDAWDVRFENLAPDRVAALISEVSAKLAPDGGAGRVTVKGIAQTAPGSYTLELHADGVEKKVYDEWVATATHTSETSEQVKYNVPQQELTDGGLDARTHVITRESRSLNRDGTWNEQITRVKPVACTLEFGSVSNHVTSHHTVYRNAEKLPAGLDPKHPTMQGSASHNEHGLVDAQTVEEDDDKVTQTSRGGDHFTRTESVTKVQDAAPAETPGVSGGVITETQDVAYPDGKHRATVTKRTAIPCEHVVTKTKSGHAPTVTHHRLTNGLAVPGPLQSPPDNMNVEGGAQHNAFGLVDAQWSEQERKDESQESRSKTYYGDRIDAVGVKDSGDGTAEQTSNSLKSYSRTTLPDGKVREQTSEETFTPRTETFYTQEGDRDHPRVVTHKVFRNQENLPEELNHSEKPGKDDLERFSGSADRNAHGTWDGHSQKYSVTDGDDKSKSETRNYYSTRKQDADIRTDSRLSEAQTFNKGEIVTVEETTFPSDRIASRKTTETFEPREETFYTQEGDRDHPRVVTHKVFHNQENLPEELNHSEKPGKDDLERFSGSADRNANGTWDGHSQKYSVTDGDDKGNSASENFFSRRDQDSDIRTASRLSEASGFTPGKITTVDETTFPSGRIASRKSVESSKEQQKTFSYTVYNGKGDSGTVTVTIFKNKPEVPKGTVSKEQTQHISASLNAFGYYDGTLTVSPTWYNSSDDGGAAGTVTDSYTLTRLESRRILNTKGKWIDQTRTWSIKHDLLYGDAGNMTYRDAVRHIRDGDVESKISGPLYLRIGAGSIKRGYIADRVTKTVTDWSPSP